MHSYHNCCCACWFQYCIFDCLLVQEEIKLPNRSLTFSCEQWRSKDFQSGKGKHLFIFLFLWGGGVLGKPIFAISFCIHAQVEVISTPNHPQHRLNNTLCTILSLDFLFSRQIKKYQQVCEFTDRQYFANK